MYYFKCLEEELVKVCETIALEILTQYLFFSRLTQPQG